MANCCNCSAPLPPKALKCDYCGSVNDIDLAEVNYYTDNEPESGRICPRCGIALRTIDLNLQGRFLIERCEQCLGLFFDTNELEAVIEARVSNVFTVNMSQLDLLNNSMRSSEYPVSYVKCPVCSKIMNRVNYGVRSGVIVDCCKDHGVWLDGGELRSLLEWTKAGGKILENERREAQKREEALKAERSGAQPPGQWSSGDCDSELDLFGDLFRVESRDVFRLARAALDLFLK